jgi:hypothetical protein
MAAAVTRAGTRFSRWFKEFKEKNRPPHKWHEYSRPVRRISKPPRSLQSEADLFWCWPIAARAAAVWFAGARAANLGCFNTASRQFQVKWCQITFMQRPSSCPSP